MQFQLETVSVTVPEDALEPFEAAFGLACRTVGLFLTHEVRRIWTIEGVKLRGQGDAELQSGLALATLLTGEDRSAAAACDRGGRMAGQDAIVVPGAACGPAIRDPGYASSKGPCSRPDNPGAGRGGGVRIWRTQFHAGLPSRPGGRGLSPAAPHPGPRLRVGDSRHGRGSAPARACPGDRHRSLVGPRRGRERRRQRPAEPSDMPGRSRVATAGPGRRAL